MHLIDGEVGHVVGVGLDVERVLRRRLQHDHLHAESYRVESQHRRPVYRNADLSAEEINIGMPDRLHSPHINLTNGKLGIIEIDR